MIVFKCEHFFLSFPHGVSSSQWTIGTFFTDLLCFQIADDDKILPGVEGKIVVWVEEE